MGTVCGLPPGQQYPLPGIVQYFSIRPCQVCPHVTQGNRIWDFLDIRVAEKARVCLLSTSSGANWMVHGPQNGGFRQPQFDLCRRNHLHDLRSVPEKSKCDCPGEHEVRIDTRKQSEALTLILDRRPRWNRSAFTCSSAHSKSRRVSLPVRPAGHTQCSTGWTARYRHAVWAEMCRSLPVAVWDYAMKVP